MIALLDYGAGNVGSVLKAVQYLGCTAEVVCTPELLVSADKIILPGQGHFAAMMQALGQRRLLGTVKERISANVPYLGICLGLQALYESSEEAPGVPGFGILKGSVTRFKILPKVPHIGWNQLRLSAGKALFDGVPDGSFAYFCHSYFGPVVSQSVALTEYGETYSAGIEKNQLWAVQFHPEKSGEVGLQVLRNFLQL